MSRTSLRRSVHGPAVLVFAAVVLAALAPGASAEGAVVPFRGKPWPDGKVTYWDATPASYRWSVDYAVQHLNSVGAKVTFVKAKSRAKANLVLTHKSSQLVPGMATLGYTRGRQSTATFNRRDRDQYATAMLVAHELGHVLGLDHPAQTSTCSLMNPSFFLVCTPKVTDSSQWVCGLARSNDVAALRGKYGSRRSTARTGLCSVFDELPAPVAPALTVGAMSWTDDALQIQLSWTPAVVSAQQMTRVQFYNSTCAAAVWEDAANLLTSPDSVDLPMAAGSTTTISNGTDAGQPMCIRTEAFYRTSDGVKGRQTYGAPVDLTAPARPAA